MYNKIDSKILDQLRNISGEENVSVSPEDKETYSHDEVAELKSEPEAIIRSARPMKYPRS